jgi:SSS family solute:Na+ symporter
VSLLNAPDGPEKTDGLTWTPAVYRAETLALRGRPAWANYRVIGAALLLVTAVIVVRFR